MIHCMTVSLDRVELDFSFLSCFTVCINKISYECVTNNEPIFCLKALPVLFLGH